MEKTLSPLVQVQTVTIWHPNTCRCPHQPFSVSQGEEGSLPANKSEISLTSKASRMSDLTWASPPHFPHLPPPCCYTNRLPATRLDSDLVDEEIQIGQQRLSRPQARAKPRSAAGLPR